MNFKKLSVLFCSLLALTSVMAVSAAETETVSETEAASEEESTASGADEETEYPITVGKTRTRRWHSALLPWAFLPPIMVW